MQILDLKAARLLELREPVLIVLRMQLIKYLLKESKPVVAEGGYYAINNII